jgi:RHH-type proline utilization regulon transcriptional repressor/proline dehydrogenase/delta 1-pyrroline-5-carboxylate dehydrogenase
VVHEGPGLQDPALPFRRRSAFLKSSGEIVRHLQEYLGDKAVELNPALKASLAASSFAPALVATPVKAQIVDMAGQFVAGQTGEDLLKQIKKNAKLGLATTIDLLGETVLNEVEADIFLQRNLEILDSVSKFYARDPAPCFSDLGPKGALPRLNLSVKISALTPDVHPADPENSIAALKERFRPILRRAAEVGALINFDMESYKLKDLTLQLFKSIFEEPEFAQKPAIGIAIQAYLRDCETDLRDLVAWARAHNRPLSVRLVKGAYWDYETIIAQQRDWPIPVWQKKPESDANYEKLSLFLLENIDIITPNFASHNVRSVAHVIAQAERLGIDPRAYEFQALYGMADELKLSLIQLGHRVREYCPVGELLPGMAYLVRRLLENTSNEGFLRIKNMGEATKDQLLGNPVNAIAASPEPLARKPHAPGAFVNAANTDYTLAANRDKQRAALTACAAQLGKKWPLIINGKKITDREYIASINPAKPSQVIGSWARATVADAESAVAASVAAFPKWRATPVDDRAKMLERAADLMESRRFELNALLILEAGKPWIEADGDISEAIDFCRYYAVEMRKLAKPVVTQAVPGERCVQTWTPRGVGVAIAPWNFPLAILTGLVVAPLVGGQLRHHEARRADLRHRRRVDGHPRRVRRARRRAALRPRLRRGRRRAPRRPQAGGFHRLHRLARRRLQDLGDRRPDPARPTNAEKSRLRDGRQERARHRQRRRPRRGHPGRALQRLRLQRPEMLRALAAHRARRSLRSLPRALPLRLRFLSHRRPALCPAPFSAR